MSLIKYVLFFSIALSSPFLWASPASDKVDQLAKVIPHGYYRLFTATGPLSEECPNENDPLVWRVINNDIQLQIHPGLVVFGKSKDFIIKNVNIVEVSGHDKRKFYLTKKGPKKIELKMVNGKEEQFRCILGFKSAPEL